MPSPFSCLVFGVRYIVGRFFVVIADGNADDRSLESRY